MEWRGVVKHGVEGWNVEWWNMFYHCTFYHSMFYHSTPDFIVCHFYYGVDHHSLWLYVLLFPGSTKWCHLFPNYFFFLLSFCPPWPTQNVETHLTLDKKGMVLAHVLPLGRPTTKLTRRGIRSVDKLLNASWFTVLFKNTRTLKFAFFAAVIHLTGPLRTENFA